MTTEMMMSKRGVLRPIRATDSHGRFAVTHGLSGTKIRRCWSHIKQRCFNENNRKYKHYGGRGITMFRPWIDDFLSFYNFVSTLPGWDNPELSIDRINNDGHYEPGNLRWATKEQQKANRRNTNPYYRKITLQ